jgi:4-amino-4-deoxy-L-arabinose transferase-like glycosyltransferase
MSLAAGSGYIGGDGLPTAYWPVGYPAFLSLGYLLMGPSPLVGKALNCLLYPLIAWATYMCARQTLKNRETSVASLLLLAFYPNHIAYSSLLLTEYLAQTLLLFTAALQLAAQDNLKLAALAGATSGLAALTKPQLICLPIVIAVSQALGHSGERRFRIVVVCVIAMTVSVVVISPWTWRNYRVFRAFVPVSTNGGVNLLIGNSRASRGGYFELQFKELEGLDEVSRDRRARELAIGFLRAEPLVALRLIPRKLKILFARDGDGFSGNAAGLTSCDSACQRHFLMMKIIAQMYYMLMVGLGIIGLYALGAEWRGALLCLSLIGYVAIVTAVSFGSPRFHFLFMPLLLTLSAAGVVFLASPWMAVRGGRADGGGNSSLP